MIEQLLASTSIAQHEATEVTEIRFEVSVEEEIDKLTVGVESLRSRSAHVCRYYHRRPQRCSH